MTTQFLTRMTFVALSLAISFTSFAQTLPPITFSQIPDCLAPGMTATLAMNPVPGASGYRYETDSIEINTIIFNNLISPVSTLIPSVALTGVLSLNYYTIHITAYNASSTSPTATIQIPGRGTLFSFAPGNIQIASPNSSHNFSVQYTCIPPAIYLWEATGDVSFSNGTQQWSGGATTTVYFGNNFGSGTICVRSVNSSGLQSPPQCIPVFNPNYTPD